MYTRQEENAIVLCSFPDLTYKNRVQLLSGLRSATPAFDAEEESVGKGLPAGVYRKIRTLFADESYRRRVLADLEKKGVSCITYFSGSYPEELSHIPCPPLVLYCKGNTELLKERRFAVVGSRRTSTGIWKECKKISAALTEHFAVVSGMADGADSAALEGALSGGKVISVLANGFDYVYPAVNARLTERVAQAGLLISEYPPDVPPRSYQFPVRNRIIAGLAEAVLVVSAGKKSGALITAEYALDYGRTVFAFPYSLGVSSGEGCNALLKNGGILAENILDIFSLFGLDCKASEKVALTAEEKELLDAIREEESVFLSALAERAGKEPYQLIPLISSLEIKGYIARVGGNRYTALK